jgi:hypothetical protein
MERARTASDGETKGSEQDSHNASIKREEGIGVNFPRVPTRARARNRKERSSAITDYEHEWETDGSHALRDAANFLP